MSVSVLVNVQTVVTEGTDNVSLATIGLQGPAGPGADLHYTHTQSIASATWNVVHNLGKFPSVSVVDSAGNMWVSDVHYINANSLTISFAAAFGGVAYIN